VSVSNKSVKKYHYIDALRGIAIIGVIIIHVGEMQKSAFLESKTKYGQLGVQLFFVASALTLCLSMEKRGADWSEIKRFFIRRYFRIAPLYYIGILIYFAINLLLADLQMPNGLTNYTVAGILTNAFFIHGFVPAYNNNIIPGGWSIGTEMAFYLVFPMLFKWLNNKTGLYLLTVLIGYVALSLLIIVMLHRYYHLTFIYNNKFYYNNLFNQLTVFLWGFLLYKDVKSNIITRQVYNFLLFFAALLAIYINWKYNWSFSFYLIPAFAGMAFFALGSFLKSSYVRVVLLEKFGQLSFSIYILHWIVVWYIFPNLNDYFDNKITSNVYIGFVCDLFLTLTISFLLARITEKYIENPGIELSNKLLKRKP
jgi:peptidoglycan/LPS O-acetylase OafA/YrhL